MISNADMAMYRAKAQGRNTREFYTRAMSAKARSMLETETALRRALRQQELELHYQPQMDLGSGAIRSVEALIRWNRPGVGMVPPGEFIALAEERGFIGDIGEWTLQCAASQAAAWQVAGLPPFSIGINLSATQFHRSSLVEHVAGLLRSRQLGAQRIEFEITEGVIMQDADATIEIFKRLHQCGVLLSIDDFGTGYSSLSYLRRFPIDKIKVDRSFISEMTTDSSAAGIVRGIIELAHSLRLQVIAEGVETAEQLGALRELRCDRVQGFFIARPMPVLRFEEFMRAWPQRRTALFGC
jgi:EAL domain-containing protein (putative c-di-GMP-specific phosphodiesterase class I)